MDAIGNNFDIHIQQKRTLDHPGVAKSVPARHPRHARIQVRCQRVARFIGSQYFFVNSVGMGYGRQDSFLPQPSAKRNGAG